MLLPPGVCGGVGTAVVAVKGRIVDVELLLEMGVTAAMEATARAAPLFTTRIKGSLYKDLHVVEEARREMLPESETTVDLRRATAS